MIVVVGNEESRASLLKLNTNLGSSLKSLAGVDFRYPWYPRLLPGIERPLYMAKWLVSHSSSFKKCTLEHVL